MNKPIISIIVLISGRGSNLQAIIDAIKANTLPVRLAAVISNVPNVYGLHRAHRADIPTHVVEHDKFQDRSSFDAALSDVIDRYDADLLVLAGFMRILGKRFIQRYQNRIINLHPSLLPKYPGLNTHQKVIEEGDAEHGASVHFVTTELDAGPIIIQGRFSLAPDDTASSVQQRVHAIEHQILPQGIRWFAQNRLEVRDNSVLLDGERSPEQGLSA